MLLFWISLAVAFGVYLAWTIGANDFANSMSDAVGARALSVKWAVVLGGLCELAGSVLAGSSVTDTVRRGIVSPHHFEAAPELLVVGMFCSLLATALWLHLASSLGWPVSTTHSIVAAVAGFGLVSYGVRVIHWTTLGNIVMSWIVSPLAGFALAFVLFRICVKVILHQSRPLVAAVRWAPVYAFLTIFCVAFSTLYKGLDHFFARHHIQFGGWKPWGVSLLLGLVAGYGARQVLRRRASRQGELSLSEQLRVIEKLFAPLVVLTSCSVAFAHGANDVANAIGPVAAIVDVLRSGSVKMKVVVPFWLLTVGGVGIVAGVATYGYRVMMTVGLRLTQLTPSRGTCADIATMATVLVCTRLKLPVSTTHTLVGAIVGVGAARGLEAVNGRVFWDIIKSWLITVPFTALLSGVFFWCGRAFHLDEIVRSVWMR